MGTEWVDKDGVLEILEKQKRFGVFWDMGTGKTALLLGLIDRKIFQGVNKILIIAPKVVTLTTWQNEIRKWSNFNYLEPIVTLIEGAEDKRIKMLQNTGNTGICIHIISSSLFTWLVGKKVKKGNRVFFIDNKYRPKYDMIIVDECSEFKDPKSNRFKALKSILTDDTLLFLLSGTPFPNVREITPETKPKKYPDFLIGKYKKADEMYYAFYLLGIYKKSAYDFQRDFCFVLPYLKHTYFMHSQVYDALQETISQYSLKKELQLDVEKHEYKIYCKSDQQRFNTLRKMLRVMTDDFKNIEASSIAHMMNQALQLANGFIYDEFHVPHRINHYKFEKLKELLETIAGNVVIFYVFKEDKEYLLSNLPGARLYEGKQDEDDWNAGKIKYLILSPFSNKFGLNLQKGGNTVIWFGLVWSAEAIIQGYRRIYRRGQEKDVEVYFLLAENTYDDYVYDVFVSKKATIEGFLEYNQKTCNET